jgi:hypothetical protein
MQPMPQKGATTMEPKRHGEREFSKRRLFELLKYEPHEGQVAVHGSRASRRVVACGVRWGKTMCAAQEGLCAALEPRERSIGWVVAPTYDLAERVFSQIALTAMTHLRHRVVKFQEHEHRLILRNFGGGLSEIRGKSADNPVSLLGEGLDWLIVDEAARLKPTIWQNHLVQRLLDKRGWALLISTPRGKGWFFDLWRLGQRHEPDADFQSWNLPSWSSSLLDRDLIEKERARLPERTFRQEYGAEFLEGSGAVFRNVRDLATGVWQEPIRGERYFAGLDIAKVEDYTVLVIMNRNYEVVLVDRFHRLDWNLQVQRIKGHCDRFGRASVLCDTTGVGEPIYESMLRAGMNAEPYPFTSKSKNDLVSNLSILLEQRQLVLPKVELWPEGIDELESFEYSVSENGNVRTGAPSGMNDDCVVALALSAMNRKRAPGPIRFIRCNSIEQVQALIDRCQ